MKIAICVHLFNLKLYDEFINYIKNVTNVFEDHIILINLPNIYQPIKLKRLISTIKKDVNNCIILINENRGVDIYSFLIMLNYIKINNINPDYILKLHTKTHTEKWRKTLIRPLVDNENLLRFKNELFLKDNIGVIGASEYIIENDDEKWISNKYGFELLEKMFNINFNYKYFVGGTMFWINYKCLQNFLNNYEKINNYMIKKFSFGKPVHQRSGKIGFEYLYERIFSGYLTKDYDNYAINNDNEFNLINNDFLKNNKSKFSKKIFNYKNLEIRNLEFKDYNKKYLNLLSQLTVLDISSIDYELFKSFVLSLNNNHIVLVIEDNLKNCIIGTITILIEQKLIRNFGKVAHIEDVVIDKDFRGKGIGKLLIQEAIKIAHKNKCYKIILDCDETNVPFYEKCNFKNKGSFMAYYF
jgi:glucosamine-phosphate N-acetyltransferase